MGKGGGAVRFGLKNPDSTVAFSCNPHDGHVTNLTVKDGPILRRSVVRYIEQKLDNMTNEILATKFV